LAGDLSMTGLLTKPDPSEASFKNRRLDDDSDEFVYLRHKGREAAFHLNLLSTKKYAVGPGLVSVFLANRSPAFRTHFAVTAETNENLMFVLSGGIGDQICAEPTVRYALEKFGDRNITVLTHVPECFQHLPVAALRNDQETMSKLDMRKYWQVETCVSQRSLLSDFFSMCMVHCIDMPPLAAFQRQLPPAYKFLILMPVVSQVIYAESVAGGTPEVVIHPGKTWQSRTIPADYWRELILGLNRQGVKPLLIGGSVINKNSTVDIDLSGLAVKDVRDQLSIMETCHLLQKAKVVLTNDSGPYHLAASGSARIGVFSTGRPFHFIHHYDKTGKLNPNIKDLALGNALDLIPPRPDVKANIRYDELDEQILRSFLPPVETVIDFTLG
jgi:hypothetical protein